MRMRRFTQLMNAFSKKFENDGHALELYFVSCSAVAFTKAAELT
jgi:hypothetical protein